MNKAGLKEFLETGLEQIVLENRQDYLDACKIANTILALEDAIRTEEQDKRRMGPAKSETVEPRKPDKVGTFNRWACDACEHADTYTFCGPCSNCVCGKNWMPRRKVARND